MPSTRSHSTASEAGLLDAWLDHNHLRTRRLSSVYASPYVLAKNSFSKPCLHLYQQEAQGQSKQHKDIRDNQKEAE